MVALARERPLNSSLSLNTTAKRLQKRVAITMVLPWITIENGLSKCTIASGKMSIFLTSLGCLLKFISPNLFLFKNDIVQSPA